MICAMEMADVILIFEPGQSSRLDDEALAESFAATNVERPIEGAVSCTIPADMVHAVARFPGVAYVRRVQAYTGSADS
jgi:hypothetical protein